MDEKNIEMLIAAIFKRAIRDIERDNEQKPIIIWELRESLWNEYYNLDYIINEIERTIKWINQ